MSNTNFVVGDVLKAKANIFQDGELVVHENELCQFIQIIEIEGKTEALLIDGKGHEYFYPIDMMNQMFEKAVKSNSYQRAKARVKELEEQNLLIQRELSAYKESNEQLTAELFSANKLVELADHYSTKLRENYEEQLDNRNQMIDVREKQVETYKEQSIVQQKTIKRLAILAIGLVLVIIGLIATS